MWLFFTDFMPTWTIGVMYGIEVISVLAMIFLERKNPRSVLIWTLLFLLDPFISFALYIFFGKGPTMNRIKWAKNKKITDERIRTSLKHGEFKKVDIESIRVKELINLNESMNFPCTIYNKVDFFVDAHEMYDRQIEDILNAKSSINMSYYLFKNDEAGRRFISALTKKAREGVQVNLMYDSAANRYHFSKKLFKPLIEAGGHVEAFFSTRLVIVNLNNNYRNHRKITVIDDRISYVGGMNIGVDYLGEDKRIKPWRDTSIRIEGEATSFLFLRFLQDFCANNKNFNNELFENIIANSKVQRFEVDNISPIQVVSSGPDTPSEEIKYNYIKMLSLAKNEVYIETPYYIPDDSFYDAILMAQSSGVQVHLIIPGVYDHKMVYYVTISNLEPLLRAGVKVYLYNGFIHAKMMVADDIIASVGSANFDIRSFELNFEVNAILYGKEEVSKAKEIALKDIENSKEVTLAKFESRSRFEKIKERFFSLFSQIM